MDNIMKRLSPYLLFYKSFALWSLAITSILAFAELQFTAIALSKVLLLFLLWQLLEFNSNQKVIDYIVNQELSTIQFFGIIYIIDFMISIPFVLILNEFI